MKNYLFLSKHLFFYNKFDKKIIMILSYLLRIRKCIPAEQYNRLRKQWKELWRRHQEFRTILFSVPSISLEMSKAGFSYTGVRATKGLPLDSSVLLNQSTFDNQVVCVLISSCSIKFFYVKWVYVFYIFYYYLYLYFLKNFLFKVP